MTYKTHVAFTATLALPIATALHTYGILPSADIPPFTLATLIATLFPDIDHARSFISKRFPLFSFIIRFFAKHRGFTHSLYGIVSLASIVGGLYYYHFLSLAITLGIIIGYSLHIFGDAMTKSGIRHFCCYRPLYLLPKIIRFKTGSKEEQIAFILFIALFFVELKFL